MYPKTVTIENLDVFLEKFDKKSTLFVFDLDDTLIFFGRSAYEFPYAKLGENFYKEYTFDVKSDRDGGFWYRKAFSKNKIPKMIFESLKQAKKIICTARCSKTDYNYTKRNILFDVGMKLEMDDVLFSYGEKKIDVVKRYFPKSNVKFKDVILIDDLFMNVNEFKDEGDINFIGYFFRNRENKLIRC